jgi:hypothetical protein
MAGVNGGWHDAADFDRRIFHYAIIWDLLAPYSPARSKESIEECGEHWAPHDWRILCISIHDAHARTMVRDSGLPMPLRSDLVIRRA